MQLFIADSWERNEKNMHFPNSTNGLECTSTVLLLVNLESMFLEWLSLLYENRLYKYIQYVHIYETDNVVTKIYKFSGILMLGGDLKSASNFKDFL